MLFYMNQDGTPYIRTPFYTGYLKEARLDTFRRDTGCTEEEALEKLKVAEEERHEARWKAAKAYSLRNAQAWKNINTLRATSDRLEAQAATARSAATIRRAL